MRRLTIAIVGLAIAACAGPAPTGSSLKSAKKPRTSSTATASPTKAPTTSGTPDPVDAGPTPTPGPTATPTPSSGSGADATPTPAPANLGISIGAAQADTWLPGPSLRRPRAGLTAGVIKGVLFAFEGESRPSSESVGASGDWVLDASYDMTLPDFPEIAARGGRMFAVGAVGTAAVVTAGGHTGSGRSGELLIYGENGLEGALGAFAQPFAAAAGGKLDGKVAAAGGMATGDVVTNAMRLWDVAGESESAGASMPLGVAGATGAVVGGKLYVLGGYTLDGQGRPVAQARVQIYDPAGDSWRHSSDGQAGAPAALPAARHSAAAAVHGGKIYLVGGVDPAGATLASGAVYDPAANTWTAIAAMPTPRAVLALAVHQGGLWALGGFGANKLPLTTVEVYQP